MKNSHSLEVLFEDQWIIVVNKPSGMLSVRFPGFHGKSAQDILTEMHRSRGKLRIAAVHRLDRDTSGVMMFACTAEAKERIMYDWQGIVSERIYRCVCRRALGADALPDSGTIDARIAYNRVDVGFVPRPSDRAALKDAETAVTHYRVIARGKVYDLVECELETGRKNQIRVHMAHIGHPVAGDEVYGTADDGMDSPIGRLALHARVLAFTHPFTGDPMRFETPESAEFAKIVNAGAGRLSKTGHTGVANPSGRAVAQKRVSGTGGSAKGLPRRKKRGRESEGKIEEITDLQPLPKKSRTRQDNGRSKFIPGK